MQDSSQSSLSPMKKRILLAGGAVIVLILVAVGTILILKGIAPKKETAASALSVKADELIALYSVPGAVKGLSDNAYDQQLDDGLSVPVSYKLSGRDYTISTMTPHSVLFYSKTIPGNDDTKAVQDQTTIFMHDKGYNKVANPATSQDATRVTYASDRAVCQLNSSGKETFEGSPASHQLACVQNTAIVAEYAEVDKLIALYERTKARPTFSEAIRMSEMEGNKAYSTLRLKTSEKKSPNLLFAAVDNDWSFLGDLSSATSETNAKYAISPEIRSKIKDAKYGDFLTKNLEGKSNAS